jgi:hypothetical protein
MSDDAAPAQAAGSALQGPRNEQGIGNLDSLAVAAKMSRATLLALDREGVEATAKAVGCGVTTRKKLGKEWEAAQVGASRVKGRRRSLSGIPAGAAAAAAAAPLPRAHMAESKSVAERLKALSNSDPALLKPAVVRQLLSGSISSGSNTHVLGSSDVRCTDAELTGGKGSSLAILNTVEGVTVPTFFCVTTTGFREVLNSDKAAVNLLDELQKMSDATPTEALEKTASAKLRSLFTKAGELRVAVEELPFPDEIRARVESAYADLCATSVSKSSRMPVAVRSSATTEVRSPVEILLGPSLIPHLIFLNADRTPKMPRSRGSTIRF